MPLSFISKLRNIFIILSILLFLVSCNLNNNYKSGVGYMNIRTPKNISLNLSRGVINNTGNNSITSANIEKFIIAVFTSEGTEIFTDEIGSNANKKIEIPAGNDLNIHIGGVYQNFIVYHDHIKLTLKEDETKDLSITMKKSPFDFYIGNKELNISGYSEYDENLIYFGTSNDGIYYYLTNGGNVSFQKTTVSHTTINSLSKVTEYDSTNGSVVKLWAATPNGIYRYTMGNDGSLSNEGIIKGSEDPNNVSTIYDIKLNNNRYLYVVENNKGFYMIKTDEGTFDTNWTGFKIKDYLDLDILSDIEYTDDTDLANNYAFLATAIGTIGVDTSDLNVDLNNLDVFGLKSLTNLNNDSFFTFHYLDTTNILYLGAPDGLYTLDLSNGSDWHSFIQSTSVNNLKVTNRIQKMNNLKSLFFFDLNNYSLANETDVKLFANSTWRSFQMWDGIAYAGNYKKSQIVFHFISADGNKFWIGSRNGIVSYDIN